MSECCNVSIEKMKKDLIAGGWTPSHAGMIWTSLSGASYRGPHKAWHVWAGVPMDGTDKRAAERRSKKS